MSSTNVLRNPQYELYAQGIVRGLSKLQAYQQAGYKGEKASSVTHISSKPEIKARIRELLESSSRRAELSRKDILDRIFQDWELARKLGQCASALKAGELMGKELHRMFVDRREVGGPGDFDAKSEDELKEIIHDGLRELGWKDLPSMPDNKTTH
jgi:Terminase small subunit